MLTVSFTDASVIDLQSNHTENIGSHRITEGKW